MAGVLAFFAGYALYAHVPANLHGLPFPVFTGLLYTTFVVLAASVTTYFLPNLRRLIDGVALTRLGFALWVVAAHGQEVAASPTATAAIVVGGAAVLLRLGVWLDRTSRRPSAPALMVTLATQGRAVTAWLDNAPARSTGRALPLGLATA
jgi:hypothetical protein